MPAKTIPADFFDQFTDLGNVALEYAKTPVKMGIVDLPAGITAGIARLDECYFGDGDGGKYWLATGLVEAPLYFGNNGSQVPIKGLRTRLYVPFKPDGGEGLRVSVDRVMNTIKQFMGEGVFASLNGDQKRTAVLLASLTEKLAAVAKVPGKPEYFRFSTDLEKPSGRIDPKTGKPYEPRVRHWWNGVVTGYVPQGLPATNGTAVATPGVKVPDLDTPNPKVAAAAKAPVRTTKAPLPVQPEPVTVTADDEDVLSLLDLARNNDKEADARLRQLAAEKGHDDDEFDKAKWEEIEGWFTADGGAGDDPFGPVRTPEIGEVLVFSPANPKDETGVKRLKGEQFEVVEVHTNTETMSLRSIKGVKGKKLVVDDVAWSDPNVTWDV